MIYTYWYGFICKYETCGKFNAISSYDTNVELGLFDLDPGDSAWRCKHCQGSHTLLKSDVVASMQRDEMVPLHRQQ
jgi:hypothetical protein